MRLHAHRAFQPKVRCLRMSRPAGTSSLARDAVASIKNPEFWFFSAWLDLITKYRRSKLGVVWLVVPPAASYFVIGYFYAGLTGRTFLRFVPYMGLGYMLWRFVTHVISEVSTTMVSHRAFIMDGRTRLTDYVLRCVSRAFLYLVVAALVLSAILAASPDVHLPGALLAMAALPVLLLNVFCLGVVVAMLGARYPDMHEFTATIFIFGFLLTPILWYPENLPHGSLRWIFMQFNPAYHFIDLIRSPLLGRALELRTIYFVVVATLVSMLTASVLYRRYARFVPLWI